MDRRLDNRRYMLYKYPWVLYEFLVFGFVGLLIETSYVYFVTGHWTVRGSLGHGLPIIHIYAFGSLIVVYWLGRISRFPVLFFGVSAVFMTLVELVGSYLEDMFGSARTWNYSGKPFNFEGRVCLSVSLGWGALAFLFYFLMYPEIRKLIGRIPRRFMVLSSVFLTFYIVVVTMFRYFI